MAAAVGADAAPAPAFAATASVSQTPRYIGDATGSLYTFTVNNTGSTAKIGAVEIDRPDTSWTITGCSGQPSGWAAQTANTKCRFRSADTAADDIPPGATRTFTVRATTAPGTSNRSGTWGVVVSKSNQFDTNSLLKNATPATTGSLTTTLFAFELTDAVVSEAAGSSCPAANKEAVAGSTRTIVICGRNRATTALTPVAGFSSLSGTLIASPGTFSAASIPATSGVLVLGRWTGTHITSVFGLGNKTVIAQIGSANNRTSPLVTFTGYSATNQPPVANADSYSTNEDTALVIAAPGVLGNDTDPESDPLTAALQSGPTSGALTLHADGSFSYTPNADFHGSDSFTYVANDGLVDSAPATVSLTVSSVNDPPVAGNVTATTNEDTAKSVTLAATDVDGDALTYSVDTGPAHGTLGTVSGAGVTYTPDADYHGSDSFTFHANDGAANSNTATASLTVNSVNDAPVAVNDSYNTDEDTALVVPANGVLGNDTDVDGDPLTVSSSTGAAHGTAVVNADGSFTYTPDAGYHGSDAFTYVATDGTADSNTATVNLTVSSVNDPPVATNVTDATDEDTAKTITLTATDADGDALTYSVGTGPTHGSLGVVSGNTVTYVPAANYHGPDSFTFVANDGFANSNTATVSLTVNPVNDAPVAGDDSYQTVADTQLNVVAPGVLVNDTDVDGDALTAAVGTTTTHGTLTLNANGSFSYSPDSGYTGGDSFTYTAGDGTTTDSATVTLTVVPANAAPTADNTSASGNEDGGPITVNLSGDDADGDALTFSVGAVSHGTLASPTAPVCTGAVPNHCTSTVAYTPAADYNGPDSFSYAVYDGSVLSSPATASLTVNAVNDAPAFTKGSDQTVSEDSGAASVPGWATGISSGPADESSQVVSFVATTNNDALFAALPAVSSSGDLSFTPAANANGSATVTVNAHDDGGTTNGGVDDSATQTFTVTVSSVNDAPSFTAGGNQTVIEDAGAQSVTSWATAISRGPANESGQTVSFQITANDHPELFSAGPSVSPTGTLSWTGAPNRYGLATISVVIKDDGGTANGGVDTSGSQSFTIALTAVNDPPVAASKAYTVQANMKISLGGLLTGATDPNDVAGNPSWTPSFTLGSITVGAGCVGCTVSNVDTAAGTFDFDPPAGGSGAYSVSYTVTDNGEPGPGATSAPATITFTVNGPVIWFVDTTAGAGGTGRLSAPFSTLPAATTALGTNTNQRIFVSGGNVSGNVTLPTDGWLISEAATGADFDTVMGITPPAGTIARPAVNGTQRTLTGTVTLGTNSNVRGFNLTPASGSKALVASGRTGLVVNQVSATTTNARAVDLASSSGTVTLKSVTATGADRGISLVNVNPSSGSFSVTGSGTAGSGGTISGSTAAGSVGSPEGGIYLTGSKGISLDRMVVSGGAGNGLYGNTVTGLTLASSSFSSNGTDAALDHDGIRVDDLLGTSSITGVDVSGSKEDNAKILNTTGTATLTISSSSFHDNDASVGAAGLYVQAGGTSTMTFTSTNNTFSGNRINGLSAFAQTSGSMSSTITGGSATNNGNVGVDVESNGTGGYTFDVNGVTTTGCVSCTGGSSSGIHVYKGSSATGTGTSAMVGQVRSNNVNGSGYANAPGIWVHGEGSGQLRLAVTGNTVTNVKHRGIYAALSNGAGNLEIKITGNTVTLPNDPLTLEGVEVESGILSADTVSTCADVKTNTVTDTNATDLRVRNRQAGTLLRLPGYAGTATDMTAVANFLLGQNTAADANATFNASGPGITGGAACNTPV